MKIFNLPLPPDIQGAPSPFARQQGPAFPGEQRSFSQTPKYSNFGEQNGRFTKEELRAQIDQKSKNLQELQVNKQFFEEELGKKVEDFKAKLKEIKPQVFDKVFKANLHYIYKHYENYKNGLTPREAGEILHVNLAKQRAELDQLALKNEQLINQNKNSEQHLLELANKGGIIRPMADNFDKMTKEEIESRIRTIERENGQLEGKINELRKAKDKELMQLQIELEQKGRSQMEKRAITLALEYVEDNNFELAGLKHQVQGALKEIQMKNEMKKNNPYYQLMKKKEKLQKEIQRAKMLS